MEHYDTHGTLTVHGKYGSLDGPDVTITLLKWAGCVILNEQNCMHQSIDDVCCLCKQLERIVIIEKKTLIITRSVRGDHLNLRSNYDGLDIETVTNFCIRYTGLVPVGVSTLIGINKFQKRMLIRHRLNKRLYSKCSQFLKCREGFFGSDVADMIVHLCLF